MYEKIDKTNLGALQNLITWVQASRSTLFTSYMQKFKGALYNVHSLVLKDVMNMLEVNELLYPRSLILSISRLTSNSKVVSNTQLDNNTPTPYLSPPTNPTHP